MSRSNNIKANFLQLTLTGFPVFNFPIFQFFNLSIFQSFNFPIFLFLIHNSSLLIAQSSLDNLTYNYKPNTNQLKYITDVVDSATSAVDLDNQSLNNYTYDASGQLTKDNVEGILAITWTVSGKVKQVNIDDNGDLVTDRSLQFKYDALANRVKKVETDLTGVNPPLTTYYIRNATGALISVYEDDGSGIERRDVSLAVGIDNAASDSITNGIYTRNIGLKNYELKDHLGNVRVVVNDVKEPPVIGSTAFTTNIKHSADYYSYGAIMPGRDYSSNSYRYGYQGKEKDDELKGTGNSYDFGARLLDPRVGRWLSPDPLDYKTPSASTYVSNDNNPINVIDPDGKEGERIVLTFDDGINVERTPVILDILKEEDIKATFFINTHNLSPKEYEIYFRMLEEGHIVASHTGKHTDKTKQSLAETKKDITNLDYLIKDSENNSKNWYVRFPYGAATQSQVDVANREGYVVVFWDIDALDWCYDEGNGTCKRPEVDGQYQSNMIDFVVKQAKETGGGILLFHDVRQYTVENLTSTIQVLKDEGYIFTNLDDLSINIVAGPAVKNDPGLLEMREDFARQKQEVRTETE